MNTTKTGIIAITLMLTFLAGFGLGHRLCQQMWENSIKEQLNH